MDGVADRGMQHLNNAVLVDEEVIVTTGVVTVTIGVVTVTIEVVTVTTGEVIEEVTRGGEVVVMVVVSRMDMMTGPGPDTTVGAGAVRVKTSDHPLRRWPADRS